MQNLEDVAIIAIDTTNLKNILLFGSEADCVRHFGVGQSTINTGIIGGHIFNKRWIIRKADYFKSNTSLNHPTETVERRFNYSKIHLSDNEYLAILRAEVQKINKTLGANLKSKMKSKFFRIYVLDSDLQIEKSYTSYQEVADALEIPIGTVRSRLNKVLTLRNPILCKAKDYPALLKKNS